MTALLNILDRLEGVRKHGGGFQALCPAHEDTNPSLSVSTGKGDRVLLKCHADCTTKSICTALDLKLSDLFEPDTKKVRKKIVATYDYRAVDGKVLYQTLRYEPKGFKQRRPDGAGDWKWSLKGVDRVLYHLPEITASPPDERIYICEGEKDCDNLAAIDLIATTCPQGAGKWKHLSDDSALNGHPITIIVDKDDAGRRHTNDVANRLHGRAAEIRILELPGDGNDASDWLTAGGKRDELVVFAKSALLYEREDSSTSGDDDCADDNEPRKSQATLLVELCDDVDLFHDDDTAYATVMIRGNMETMPVRGRAFKRWLARQFYESKGKAVHSQAKSDAIGVLEGKALFEGPEIQVQIRFAEHAGDIYLDLADEDCHVVRITAEGWEVIQNPPVRFRRPRAFQSLPIPQRGGSLILLREYINLESDDAFILLVAWLVATFRPDRPFPIFAFNSEQGSGKSTATRLLRSLVDPNVSPIRCEPREPRDLMIAANNSWVVALDNLSHVSVWLSDAMCRLSTGGGMSTRILYENDEECIFNVLRPVIINGIEELGTRSDLLDRTIRIALPTIPEEKRRPEDVLYEAFERDRPLILGAILDAVSTALNRIDQVQLDRYPRMADFAKWIVAAEPSLPWSEGEFMTAYCNNRDGAHELALEACPVSEVVRQFAEREVQWTGNATVLLKALDEMVGESAQRKKGWPKQPNSLSSILRRLAPNLRAVGVEIDFPDRTKKGRLLTVRKVGKKTVTTVIDRHHLDCGHLTVVSGDDHLPHGDDGVTVLTPTETPLTLLNRMGDGGDDGDDQIPPLSHRLQESLDEAEERAAIMEFDGELTREEAERRAGLHHLNGQVAACR